MTDNGSTANVVTAPQALAINPGYTDPETVTLVQRSLLEKGYADVQQADGKIGDATRDAIMAFRTRNNLPLVPIIDDEILDALKDAPNKAMTQSQIEATPKEIAPKVEVVALNARVQNVAWWGKLWAWVTAIPSGLLALLAAIINNIDDAVSALAPLKNLFPEVTGATAFWFAGFAVIAILLGLQSWRIERLTRAQEQVALESYKRGTIKNDLPPKDA